MLNSKKIFHLLVALTVLSCSHYKKPEKDNVTTRNIDKLEVLNKILSDTINLKLLPYQKILISDFNFLPKLPEKVIDREGEFISVSYIEYLSHNPKEKDTIFLKEQIKQNKTLDLKELSQYNYQIFNTSELIKNSVSIDSLTSLAYEKTSYSDRKYNESFILIDKPIFNKEMNRMCLGIHRPYSGENFIFMKENGKWKKTSIISRWVN